MMYPLNGEPADSFGFGTHPAIVCDFDCAAVAQVGVIDEMTDGEVRATAKAVCPACGRTIIDNGVLTDEHRK